VLSSADIVVFASSFCLSFFFNDTAPTEIYTLSLHDALPILGVTGCCAVPTKWAGAMGRARSLVFVDLLGTPRGLAGAALLGGPRSEEHTSELQSRFDLVCRLLLEKKKKKIIMPQSYSTSPSR